MMKGGALGALCFIYLFKIVVQMCVAVCTRECMHTHVEASNEPCANTVCIVQLFRAGVSQ